MTATPAVGRARLGDGAVAVFIPSTNVDVTRLDETGGHAHAHAETS
jgi:hypothetical protein